MQEHPSPFDSKRADAISWDGASDELHRATAADAPAVRDLVRAAYSKWVPLLGREPKPMSADYDAAVRDHVVDVLRMHGEMAALIEMEPEADHLLVVNVAVSPSYQGKGYGRALLAHAEEFARSLGLSELRLYTSVHLTENVKLYERVGYKVATQSRSSSRARERRDSAASPFAR